MGRKRNPSGLVLPTVTRQISATFGLDRGRIRCAVGLVSAVKSGHFPQRAARLRSARRGASTLSQRELDAEGGERARERAAEARRSRSSQCPLRLNRGRSVGASNGRSFGETCFAGFPTAGFSLAAFTRCYGLTVAQLRNAPIRDAMPLNRRDVQSFTRLIRICPGR
jgi:hypothetical protein